MTAKTVSARTLKAQAKANDARVDAAFREVCNGVQFDVFDLGKVLGAGRKAAANGADDAGVRAAVALAAEAFRKN